jgi:hypothetical protein
VAGKIFDPKKKLGEFSFANIFRGGMAMGNFTSGGRAGVLILPEPEPKEVAQVQDIAGTEVEVIPVEEFAGEYRRAGVFYTTFLWLVSLLALAWNVLCIIPVWAWRAVTKRDFSFSRSLWIVGRSKWHYSSPFVDWFSQFNHDGKVFAAGCVALDIFYNFDAIKPLLGNNPEGWLTRFWVGRLQNRQAVTNRRMIVTRLLVEEFEKFATEPEIRLVSVASGSAQSVVDAILKVPHLNIRAKLLDVDEAAIKASKERVRLAGLEDRIEIVQGMTNKLGSVCDEFQPHVVEMVGFLDYRPDRKAAQLIGRIKKQLCPGGVFLTCNINNNKEKIFLNWVLLWPMIYRTPEQFEKILRQGGFANISLYSCPFKIHTLAVCRK